MNETIIEPRATIRRFWGELWEYRELFFFLSWKDILLRYKQTVIGAAWSVLRPVLTVIVLSIISAWVVRSGAGAAPRAIVVLAALLPWQLFSDTLSKSADSLILNTDMISKVYFPRIIIPTTSLMVCMVDFLVSFVILILLMLGYGFYPTARIAVLPLLLVLAATTSLGMGYWLSALTVRYRDFRSIVPFLIPLGWIVSPVVFSSDIIPERFRLIYSLNPMVGVIDGFRWALLGGDTALYLPGFLISITLSAALFAGGAWFFLRTERGFADVI